MTVVIITISIQFSGLPNPYGGVLAMAAILLCAWFGGLGPALLIAPVMLIMTWINSDEPRPWSTMQPQEFLALTIITSLSAAIGLAGQYRRRIIAVTRLHAQKLEDQARALSQAPIVFRDIDGRIREWNQGAERLFGWTSKEAVGQLQHELLHSRFPQPWDEIQEELFRAGQWQAEVIHCDRSGKELHVAAQWILSRDAEGHPNGVAEIHNDVSELRRAEATLKEADRRKEEFLALLAHELRNPLAPIRTGLELMKLLQLQPCELEETRQVMERQLQQLVTLVDDLLDVSRISRGKLELRKREVLLSEIARSAVEAVQGSIDSAQHQLTVVVPETPILLFADPHRLAQVLSNLLDNAVKYTPPGGRIRLSARLQDDQVEITIEDSGVGVAADMLNEIFEMFTRGNREVEKCSSGLGIGLALVKSIVEMHGGSVCAASEGTDRGTLVTIRLPVIVQVKTDEAQPGGPTTSAASAERRVLIVDDNGAAASLLGVFVKNLGNQVLVANDGQEAIEVAESFQPEIVLMDLGMPRLDGYGAAKHMRQQPWGRDILLVALSGWGQDRHKKQSREAGFDHHLVKPADLADIERLLAGVPARDCFPGD